MGRTGIGLLWLCLCCAIPSSLCQLVNVASGTGKSYSQSSYYDKVGHPAHFAANGKTSGSWTLPNCIHTANNDSTPWWEVDLGKKYPVYDIRLWARSESWSATHYINHLYPLNITVDGQLCVRAYKNNRRSQSLRCTSAIYGQVVRLTRDYRAIGNDDISLNLCEVKIWVCPDGYYGAQCSYRCSSLKRCTQCYRDGCIACSGHFKPPQCTGCDVGYYKFGPYHSFSCVQCNATCVNRKCNAENGRCDNCASGSYKSGTACAVCSSNCVNRQCYFENGQCTSGCVSDRQWGNQCEESCSSHCVTYPCNRNTGKCNGCNAGWYGDKCEYKCSTRFQGCSQCAQDGRQCTVCQDEFYKFISGCAQCSSNCSSHHCDDYSGRCTQGCVSDRQWGNQCEKSCSSHCATYPCNRNTGKCNGCNAGWYGDKCEYKCSTQFRGCSQCAQDGRQCTVCQTGFYKSSSSCVQCSNNCKDGQCDGDNGRCTKGCVRDRQWGDQCKKSCSSHCATYPCNRTTGNCNGCATGYYDDKCNSPCSHIISQCGECTQGGDCTVCSGNFQFPGCAVCIDGFYKKGMSCSECTWKCDNGVPCNKTTGHCAECPAGKKGDRCTEDCDNNNYGPSRCSLSCGQCKGRAQCDPVTGHCLQCEAGWSAPLCKDAITDDDSFPSAVVGSVVGVLLVIIIAVIIVVIVFKWRHRQCASKSSGAPGTAVNMSNSTEGLNDGNNSNDSGQTPLSFYAVAVDGDPHPMKPKEGVKPKPKPAVKPKPSKPAQSTIYENVSAPEPTKPADKVKASAANTSVPPSNSKASGAASGKKPERPPTAAKPVKGKAAFVHSETPSEPEEFDVEESVYANDANYFNTPGSLVLSQLQQSVTGKLHGDTLEKEFGHLTPVKDFSTANGDRTENYYKNRFRSIMPYDWNRIQLEKVGDDDASDYVNASFIKGFKMEKGYIASQGPKDKMHDDFWRMVWQEKVTDIVMLTNLKEGIKDKCSEYWPQEGATLNTHHMQVAAVGDVETRAHFVIRTFDLKHKQGKERRRVKQYHYISWMDHEVPATVPLVSFWRYVRTRAPRIPSAPPLLVHCSAGVGRTGAFIALDITIDESEQASQVNLFNIVQKLRDDRCHMVQNKDQYVFLHEAVLEAYTSQNTRIEVTAMDTVLPINFNRNTPNTKIDAEYKMLCKMRNCPTVATYNTANFPDNAAKNRNPEVLPCDKHLVYITQHVKGRNQYINGVSVMTFLQQRGSIMTQLPLPDTVVDLWRLVDGAHVKLIVSIGDVEGQKGLHCYWPKEEEKPLKTGPYIIKIKSSAKIGNALWSYTFTMDKEGSSTREVRLLHYARWTGECADDTEELIHLLTLLQSSDKEMGGNPVIIQCIDGSLRSGVLCALWDVVSRMALDEELDVYLAARQVTIARPQAFVSVEQYRYCYEVAQQIKDSYNVYSNM